MKIVYLKPLSGYVTELRSDTLWGLLCWGIRHLWGSEALQKYLEDFEAGKPPFVVSSTFPFKYPYNPDTKTYQERPVPYFPNPLQYAVAPTSNLQEAKENIRLRKAYKQRMAYLPLDSFRKMLKGELDVTQLIAELKRMLEAEKDEKRKPTAAEILQSAPYLEDFSMTHNTIHRLRGGTLSLPVDNGEPDEMAGQLFHTGETFWSDRFADPEATRNNTGIYFLADGDDLSFLEPVLRFFRHFGIGADRTSGKGFFDYQIEDIQFESPADANAMLSLSLLHPTGEELDKLDALEAPFQYEIEIREGWGGRGYQPKKGHRYFAEAAILPILSGGAKKYPGCILKQFDQPHPVWDNGYALTLHLKWK